MFNALGLGFSFVLSFLILPEEGDKSSEEVEEGIKNGTDCSNSSLTLDDLSPVGCSTASIHHMYFLNFFNLCFPFPF